MPQPPQVIEPQSDPGSQMAPGAISGATIPEQPNTQESTPVEVEGDTLPEQLPDADELNQDLPAEE